MRNRHRRRAAALPEPQPAHWISYDTSYDLSRALEGLVGYVVDIDHADYTGKAVLWAGANYLFIRPVTSTGVGAPIDLNFFGLRRIHVYAREGSPTGLTCPDVRAPEHGLDLG